MKLEQLYEAKTTKTQKQMISQMTYLYQFTKFYKKSGTFDARKAKVGEHIVTIIDCEDETKKTAKEDEVVVKGPKGELYIVSEKKFYERYEVEKPLSDKFQKYKAKGLIMAYQYDGPTITFKASWDEDMICKKGDYLASPSIILPVPEVYRIEASVFAESYKKYGKIICGFPGVGKSTLFKEMKNSDEKVLDSDSSTFDKAQFPDNYIKHIKESNEKGYTILASSHDVVRNALIKNEMPFTLVYPTKSCKEEYLKRYKERGSPEAFITLLDKNWDKWIGECDDLDNKYCTKVKLKAGEFISMDKI